MSEHNSEKDMNPKDSPEPNGEKEKLSDLHNEQGNQAEKSEPCDKTTAEESGENYQKKYEEMNDSYLRLRAEFDNYRKRTMKEKSELIRNGGEKVIANLLPIVDDMERALNTIEKAESMDAVKKGVDLIYQKFISYLAQQGVEAIAAVGNKFDTEEFDAVATIPAPQPEMKGKVIDCVQTGYKLHDKVIRHAKVVVGE